MNGLDLKKEAQDVSPEDWVFGSSSVYCLASIPEGERVDYLPVGEVQRGIEDFQDCATRSPLNILEAKFNFLLKYNKLSKENTKWLIDNGYVGDTGVTFSDRFVAMNSGTTRSGNSLKAPLDAIRKQGLIPKKMLPAGSNMAWSDYHNKNDIKPRMEALGREFAERFAIRYERVDANNFGIVLSEDMIGVAGYAWPRPVGGVYPRVKYTPNHAFMAFRNAFYIFDNYFDSVDGDFIKQLARDYSFLDYGYRVYIDSEVKKNSSWFSNLIQKLLSFFS